MLGGGMRAKAFFCPRRTGALPVPGAGASLWRPPAHHANCSPSVASSGHEQSVPRPGQPAHSSRFGVALTSKRSSSRPATSVPSSLSRAASSAASEATDDRLAGTLGSGGSHLDDRRPGAQSGERVDHALRAVRAIDQLVQRRVPDAIGLVVDDQRSGRLAPDRIDGAGHQQRLVPQRPAASP